MSQAGPSHVLVIDDGELHDVRALLARLGIQHLEAGSFAAAELPTDVGLLVTNARHALDSGTDRPPAGMHLVVYDDVSHTLRQVLEQSSCDLVLKRPLNPDSFRLLAAQALYQGPERRRGRRVVISAPLQLQLGDRTHTATLRQLSLRGCGFSTREQLQIGSQIQVQFPSELTGGEPLTAAGPVLAIRASEKEPSQRDVAMAFRLLDPHSRRVLNDIMACHSGGGELRPRSRDAAGGAAASQADSDAPEADAAPSHERRRGPRRAFPRRVLVGGAGISHVLIGRDLSSGGMRVQPDENLALGDQLKLAVHARPGLPAIMLKAVIARDDGEDGFVLQFRDVPPSIAARLEQIVEDLPTLPPGKRSGSRPEPGVVVSELLGRG